MEEIRGYLMKNSASRFVQTFKIIHYIFCAVSVSLFLIWSNPSLTAHSGDDSREYVELADNLLGEVARDRPPGYPLALKLFKFIAGYKWQRLLVAVQFAALAGLSILLLRLYQTFSISIWTSVPASILIAVSPGLVHNSSLVLPELLLGVFITLAWFYAVKLAISRDKQQSKLLRQAFLVGLLSGIATLFKPVWLLGIIPLAIGVGFFYLKTPRKVLALMATMILTHALVCITWQMLLINRYQQYTISRIGTMALNLVSIRAGLTRHSKDTPLYRYLHEIGMLNQALILKWEDFDQFSNIKSQIRMCGEMSDKSFYRKALSKELGTFIKIQISRWPWFFLVRPSSAHEGSFPMMPGIVRYFYEGSFNWIFRPLLPFLLIISLGYGLYTSRLRPLAIISGLVIFYFSGIIALFSYQNPHFIRMRVPLEPLLLFMAFLPLCLIADRLLELSHSLW